MIVAEVVFLYLVELKCSVSGLVLESVSVGAGSGVGSAAAVGVGLAGCHCMCYHLHCLSVVVFVIAGEKMLFVLL